MANKTFSPFSKKKSDNVYNNVKNRNVYDEQDLERGQLGKAVSANLRIWVAIMSCILIFFIVWFLVNGGIWLGNNALAGINMKHGDLSFWGTWFQYGWIKFGVSLFMTLILGIPISAKLWRNYAVQNVFNDHTDINQYANDQHVALPMETMTKFDWFPDVGAHASPQVSSMISHVALSNKGINKVEAAQFYSSKDEKASGGQVLAGEHKVDDNGDIIFEKMPFFDAEFADALFEASGISNKLKKYKKYYDTTKIKYMPDTPRDAVGCGKYKTVAEYINADWELPYYEPQRPAGAYIVDTAPVNTMVLAMTRAG